MSENIKTNDYFAVRFLNEDVSPESILANGITTENSSLHTADFYKNKPKVQERFKKEDGSFDEKAYKEFYDNISTEYIGLSSINSLDFILNSYEKDPNVFSVKYGRKVEKSPVFSFVENPTKSKEGVIGFNEWTDQTLSNRELAQMNRYYDNEKGEWSNTTLNEAGFWGLLTGKSLVYATYDEDEYDDDGNLIHQKGEWKKDEWGNYYAETAENKALYDKEFVTLSEVLTDDNSAWNTFDIFDSDNINTNAWRSAIRTAAVIGSTFIPFANIGSIIKYSTAALEFAKVLPQLTKTLNGLFNEGEFDKLNRWDNYMKKFSKSNTDEARNNIFKFENLFDIVQSSYMQLAQQRAIANIPRSIGLTKDAEEAIMKTKTMQFLAGKTNGLNLGDETLEALTKASPIYKDAMKNIEKYSKISHAISMAHIISTSGGEAFNTAKEYGFDNFSSSVISLATLGAYGSLFQTDYFRSMLSGDVSFEESRKVKSILKHYLKNNADSIRKDQISTEPDKFFKKWGKNISDFIIKHYDDAVNGELGIIGGAINEGTEELVEEFASDAAIKFGQGINKIRSAITGNEYTDNYNYKDTDPVKRYLMALGGGAIGGAVFKTSDLLQMGKTGFSAMRSMFNDNKQLEKEIITLISQGKKDVLLNELQKLKDTEFASSNIDAITGEVSDNYDSSQNAMLFNVLRKGIESIDLFLSNNGLKMDYDDFEDIELMKGLRVAFLKDNIGENGVHKSLFNDYIERVTELVDLRAHVDDLTARLTDRSEDVSNAYTNTQIKRILDIIKFKEKELHALMDGNDDSYIGRLMLETNPNIMNSIIPSDKESISKNLYNTSYESLPEYLKSKIDNIISSRSDSGVNALNYMSAWKVYKALSSDDQIKNEILGINQLIKNRYVPGDVFVKDGMLYQRGFNEDLNDDDKYLAVRDYLKYLVNSGILKNYIENHEFLNEYNSNDLVQSFDNQIDYISLHLIGKSFGNTFIEGVDNVDNSNPILSYGVINDFFNDSTDENGITTKNQFVFSYKKGIIDVLNELKSKIDNNEELNEYEKYVLGKYKSSEKADEILSFSIPSNDPWSIVMDDELDIADSSIYKLADILYKKIFDADIDFKRIILDEKSKIKRLGDKYILNEDVKSIFDNIEYIINQDGLLWSILSGADSSYNRSINGIPFGANNYLNLAFKEKGNNVELIEIDNAGVNNIKDLIFKASDDISFIKEFERQSKLGVINTHKKIGLRFISSRLEALQDFVGKLSASVIGLDGEIVYHQLFDDFEITDDDCKYEENSNDEGYIEANVRIRNKTIEFEDKWHAFFSSLSESDQITLIKNLRVLYPNVEDDCPTINNNTNKADIFNNSALWNYLASRSLTPPYQYSTYKEYVNNTDMVPFDMQEEITISILKFLEGDSAILDKWFYTNDVDFSGVSSFYKLDSSGGVGKSKGILDAVKFVLNFENKGKFIKFAANNIDQIGNLMDNPNDGFTIESILSMLNNEDEFKKNFENKFLIIDECSHISMNELRRLKALSDKYNTKIVLSGDTQQSGVVNNFDNAFCLSSIKLDEQLRSLSNISISNNQSLGAMFGSNGRSFFAKSVPLSDTVLKYYTDDSGLYGIAVDGLSKTLTLKSVEDIIAKYNIAKGSSIAIYVEGEISEDLISLNPIDGYNIKITNRVSDIQGLEYDYVISNLNTNITGKSLSEIERGIQKYKDIYTVLTRSKMGVIIPDNIKFDINGVRYYSTNVKDTFKPVFSNIVNPDIVAAFSDFKKKIYNSINTDFSKSEQSISPEINIEITNREFKLNGDGVVEFATSFIPKAEVLNYQKYGFSSPEESISFRVNVLESLYRGDTEWSDKIYLVKRNGIGSDDIHQLQDIDSKKDLKENEYHLWLELDYNGNRITLGMFQNLGISAFDKRFEDSEMHKELVNLINDETFADEVKLENISFMRHNNPLYIKSPKEENKATTVKFEVVNGEITSNYHKWMNISNIFYFDPLSTSKVVDMARMHKLIHEINSLYSGIHEKIAHKFKIKTGEKYDGVIKDLLELVQYKDGKVNPKSMPDLYHRFVTFASIDPNYKGKNITQLSNEYIRQLELKKEQLIRIQNSISDEINIDAISAELSKRDIWNVSVLSFDYSTISEESELASNIGFLNRTTDNNGRSIKGYNISIINQLGDIFSDLAIIYQGRNYFNKITEKSGDGFVNPDVISRITTWIESKDSDGRYILVKRYAEYFSKDYDSVSLNEVINWLIGYNYNKSYNKSVKNYNKYNPQSKIPNQLDVKHYFKSEDFNHVFFIDEDLFGMISSLYFGENPLNEVFGAINIFKGARHTRDKDNTYGLIYLSGSLRKGLIRDNESVINLGSDNINIKDGSFEASIDRIIQPATLTMSLSKKSIIRNIPQNVEESVIEQNVQNITTTEDVSLNDDEVIDEVERYISEEFSNVKNSDDISKIKSIVTEDYLSELKKYEDDQDVSDDFYDKYAALESIKEDAKSAGTLADNNNC